MFAVELVSFHIGKHAVRQVDHLIVGGAILVRFQKLAIIGDQLLALIASVFRSGARAVRPFFALAM